MSSALSQDCRACVLAASTGFQQRNVCQPHNFSLLYYVASPFAAKGVTDQRNGFLLVFVAGLKVPKDISAGFQSASHDFFLKWHNKKRNGRIFGGVNALPAKRKNGRKMPVSDCPSSDYGKPANIADDMVALADQCEEDAGPARVCKIILVPNLDFLPPRPPVRQVFASFAHFQWQNLNHLWTTEQIRLKGLIDCQDRSGNSF